MGPSANPGACSVKMLESRGWHQTDAHAGNAQAAARARQHAVETARLKAGPADKRRVRSTEPMAIRYRSSARKLKHTWGLYMHACLALITNEAQSPHPPAAKSAGCTGAWRMCVGGWGGEGKGPTGPLPCMHGGLYITVGNAEQTQQVCFTFPTAHALPKPAYSKSRDQPPPSIYPSAHTHPMCGFRRMVASLYCCVGMQYGAMRCGAMCGVVQRVYGPMHYIAMPSCISRYHHSCSCSC